MWQIRSDLSFTKGTFKREKRQLLQQIIFKYNKQTTQILSNTLHLAISQQVLSFSYIYT